MTGIAQTLVNWYRLHRRPLPWREEQDAYKIWVSEVMLQQTRVEAVKGYYTRWLERFPDLASLADAKEEEVMLYWQGLGYYSRARNLLKGIKETQERYGGKVPENRTELEGLSGIGDYTAGAILSIAYNKKEAAVDGNVLRVFSRLFAVTEEIGLARTKKHIRQLVENVLPEECPGEFNQAIMDLGATICIPKTPRCEMCPLCFACQGKAQGLEKILPLKKKKAPPPKMKIVAALVAQQEAYLMKQRPPRGLLAGMWEFPAWEQLGASRDEVLLQCSLRESFGVSVEVGQLAYQFEHIFSHRHWELYFYECRLLAEGEKRQGRWVDKDIAKTVAFAGPHHKVGKWLGLVNT